VHYAPGFTLVRFKVQMSNPYMPKFCLNLGYRFDV
jgi:hypothetical protein